MSLSDVAGLPVNTTLPVHESSAENAHDENETNICEDVFSIYTVKGNNFCSLKDARVKFEQDKKSHETQNVFAKQVKKLCIVVDANSTDGVNFKSFSMHGKPNSIKPVPYVIKGLTYNLNLCFFHLQTILDLRILGLTSSTVSGPSQSDVNRYSKLTTNIKEILKNDFYVVISVDRNGGLNFVIQRSKDPFISLRESDLVEGLEKIVNVYNELMSSPEAKSQPLRTLARSGDSDSDLGEVMFYPAEPTCRLGEEITFHNAKVFFKTRVNRGAKESNDEYEVALRYPDTSFKPDILIKYMNSTFHASPSVTNKHRTASILAYD